MTSHSLNDAQNEVARSVRAGAQVNVINAPPGGGKSTLLARLCAELSRDHDAIVVGTPTREQGVGVARKLADVMPSGHIDLAISGIDAASIDARFARPIHGDAGRVQIRTLDSLRMSEKEPAGSVLIVDEAYQASFALGASAARSFDQIVAVGDPGQIGPVITVDTGAWAHLADAPHVPFARVLSMREDANIIDLDATYRLGQASADLVAPFYDFGFTSRRERIWLGHGRMILSELACIIADDVVSAAVHRAIWLSESTVYTAYEERPIQHRNIAVLSSLRSQAALASAMLKDRPGITVGTADQLQGGQWDAVVVIDPLSAASISDHHLSLGRLCVLLSRHTAHCSFVTVANWRDVLSDVPDPRGHHRRVRSILSSRATVSS